MKVLFIDNCYPEFLQKIGLDAKSKGLKDYDQIKNHYYSYYFGTSNFYSLRLGQISGNEADDIIINYESLQKAWANKNKLAYFNLLSGLMKKTPKFRNYFKIIGNPLIIIQQIKKYKPDIIYIQCPAAFPPILTSLFKKHCKALVCQIASNLPPIVYFENYDLVISSLPNIVEEVKKAGVRSEYMPLCFEESILKHLDGGGVKNYDVTHVGGYGKIHNQRNEILEEVGSAVNIDFWGYGIENLKKSSPILKNYHGKSWGLEYFNILASSKITLTGHISSVAGDYANNMTLFEATGCGTLLITDNKKNLSDLFEVGKEVVVYENARDLLGKIKYYLKYGEEREKISRAGQKRTLRDHSYGVRMTQLNELLEKY